MISPMKKSGPEFYDNESVFQIYTDHRRASDCANDTIEQPYIWELIGDPRGLDVLDLGCGDARTAVKFQSMGAQSYRGIEGSRRMFEKALENAPPDFACVENALLENFVAKENSFDLVVSSLVFHYIENFEQLAKKVQRALRPGGRFVFSVEHPVITSSNKSLEESSLRQAWIVDNYFERGERRVKWMGDTVTLYHRTVEDYLNQVLASGLALEALRESDPQRPLFADADLWARRRRIPLFLFLSGRKSEEQMK
jgi:SAM-dependent methyltransferase